MVFRFDSPSAQKAPLPPPTAPAVHPAAAAPKVQEVNLLDLDFFDDQPPKTPVQIRGNFEDIDVKLEQQPFFAENNLNFENLNFAPRVADLNENQQNSDRSWDLSKTKTRSPVSGPKPPVQSPTSALNNGSSNSSSSGSAAVAVPVYYELNSPNSRNKQTKNGEKGKVDIDPFGDFGSFDSEIFKKSLDSLGPKKNVSNT